MILLASVAFAFDPVLEDLGGGRIDWSSLQLLVSAEGTASTGALTSRASNEGEALNKLGHAMLDLVPKLRVTSTQLAKDLLAAEDAVADRVDANLSAWQVTEARYHASGSVELDAALPLQPLLRPAIVPLALGKERAPAPGGPTGLVVDARGLDVLAAIAPRLSDPSGTVLYAVASISAYTAAQKLPVVYVHDPADPACVRRAGSEPLFARATAVENGSDLVLDAGDAARVATAAGTSDFLLHANVAIVVGD